MKKIILASLLSLLPTLCFALSIYETATGNFLTEEEFYQKLPEQGQIVLGEYHYQPAIQSAQGEIISKFVTEKNLAGQFSVAWEFLNYPDQQNISESFASFVKEDIDGTELINKLFSDSRNPRQNDPYLAFFNATKNGNGELLGSNAPRSWKSVITKDGLSALDPKYIPPMMELGSSNYEARFAEAMGGHVSKEQLQKYYEAQCYTDSVMAWSVMDQGLYDLKFLIVGSFHSDYNDGVVAQFKRYSKLPTVSVKIVETKDMSQSEVKELLLTAHPQYGHLADFLYLID